MADGKQNLTLPARDAWHGPLSPCGATGVPLAYKHMRMPCIVCYYARYDVTSSRLAIIASDDTHLHIPAGNGVLNLEEPVVSKHILKVIHTR